MASLALPKASIVGFYFRYRGEKAVDGGFATSGQPRFIDGARRQFIVKPPRLSFTPAHAYDPSVEKHWQLAACTGALDAISFLRGDDTPENPRKSAFSWVEPPTETPQLPVVSMVTYRGTAHARPASHGIFWGVYAVVARVGAWLSDKLPQRVCTAPETILKL